MPDDNKFTKLRAINYRIPATCDTCIHGQLAAGSQWGTCARHRYLHAKHANPEGGRGVSVRADGTCPDHQVDQVKLATKGLGAHLEFFG